MAFGLVRYVTKQTFHNDRAELISRIEATPSNDMVDFIRENLVASNGRFMPYFNMNFAASDDYYKFNPSSENYPYVGQLGAAKAENLNVFINGAVSEEGARRLNLPEQKLYNEFKDIQVTHKNKLNMHASLKESLDEVREANDTSTPLYIIVYTSAGGTAGHMTLVILTSHLSFSLGVGYAGEDATFYTPDFLIKQRTSDKKQIVRIGYFTKVHAERIAEYAKHDKEKTLQIIKGLVTIPLLNICYKTVPNIRYNAPSSSINCTTFLEYVFRENIACPIPMTSISAPWFCKDKRMSQGEMDKFVKTVLNQRLSLKTYTEDVAEQLRMSVIEEPTISPSVNSGPSYINTIGSATSYGCKWVWGKLRCSSRGNATRRTTRSQLRAQQETKGGRRRNTYKHRRASRRNRIKKA